MKYTTKIKQPQIVAGIRINPKGGTFNEKQIWAIRHDAYGKELLDKGFLIVDEKVAVQPVKATAKQSTADDKDQKK